MKKTKREPNAVQRLQSRIANRLDADKDRPRPFRRTQRALADHIGISESTFSEWFSGDGAKTGPLARLDMIAEYFGVTPTFFIHNHDSALIELKPEEYRVVSHWRRFPPSVQARLMEMFDYFAGLLPEEQEARRWWNKIQRLRKPANLRAVEQALDDALSDEQRSAPDVDTTRAAQESTAPTARPTLQRKGRKQFDG